MKTLIFQIILLQKILKRMQNKCMCKYEQHIFVFDFKLKQKIRFRDNSVSVGIDSETHFASEIINHWF